MMYNAMVERLIKVGIGTRYTIPTYKEYAN